MTITKSLSFILLILPIFSQAAPYPGMGSSILADSRKGYSYLHKGFFLSTEGTTWKAQVNDDKNIFDSIRFADPDKNLGGSLSVRTDQLSKDVSLEIYTRRWMRDYPNYGFEVLKAQTITLDNSPALIVDLQSRSKSKQIRQAIFQKNNKLVIFTCLDNKESFAKSIRDCNQIIQSFKWSL